MGSAYAAMPVKRENTGGTQDACVREKESNLRDREPEKGGQSF